MTTYQRIDKYNQYEIWWVDMQSDTYEVHWTDGYIGHHVNGRLHREDGPAEEWQLKNHKAWFVKGKKLDCNTQEEFEQLMKLKAFW
jgi:hypothetical protein